MANNIDIQLNKELNRWELHFSSTPEGELSDYLVRLGYRFSQRRPRLFHAPKQNAYKMFGEDLKIALQENKSYTDIVIKPSHIPHESNIVHNKFSYVTISYKTPRSAGKKNFVIFDQFKNIAEAIAQQYGERVYGEKLISVEATPRVEKGKAKKLLEKNKIINPQEAVEDVTLEKEEAQHTNPKNKRKSLTNDNGVYTKETAGDRLEEIIIPIPATAKFDAVIKIIHDENDKYRFSTSTHKNFGDHSGGSSPVSNSSSIYETREEVLLLAFQEIVLRIQAHIEQRDSIISDQDKKNRLLNKALKATLEHANELDVDLEKSNSEKQVEGKGTVKKEKKKTKYANENGTYTKETAGDRLEEITIPIPKSAKYEASIKIIKDENDLYRYGLHASKAFGDYNGWYKGVSNTSATFKTKKEVLRKAFQSIVSRIQYHTENEDPILTNQENKNKNLRKAFTATLQFAKELDVDLDTTDNYDESTIKERETITQEKTKPKEKKEEQPDNSKSKSKKIAKVQVETIEIPIPKNARFKISIIIHKDAADRYLFEIQRLKNFGELKKRIPRLYDNNLSFPSKDQAFLEALRTIVLSIKMDIEESNRLDNYHGKYLYRTLKAIKKFAETNELDWEQVDDAKTSQAIRKGKKPTEELYIQNDLKKLVSTISAKLQDLADQTDAIGDKVLIETERIQFNDALEIKGQDSFKEDLKRILSEQEFWIKKIKVLTTKKQYVTILNQLTTVLELPTLDTKTVSNYVIAQKWTTLKEDMLVRFQELIDMKPDALHFTYLPLADGESNPNELTILRVEIESDRDKIGFLYEQKTNSLIIESFNLKSEGIVSYSGSAIPMGKLKSAISYMVAYPETLKIKPYNIAPYENLYKAQARDIENKDVTLVNVLIPKGVVNTIFEVGNVKKENAEQYAKRFPKLFALTDKTLEKATAKQLFSLVQLYPLEDYGINLDWQALRSHWQINGENTFKSLGYPTKRNYPFVHILTGYLNVSTLGDILSNASGKNQWLSVVESYRPIADTEKAITILDEKIEGLVEKRTEYIDPETGVAKKNSPDGEIYNSLSRQIQVLREHKDLVLSYQISQTSTSTNIEEKKNENTRTDKPLNSSSSKENYTIKTINPFGLAIPNIRIPNQIQTPFDEGGILADDVKKVLKQYPELSKINNKTVSDASALQLFQLAQLDISKLKVHKDLFHKEWSMRGESIFKELDFPIDMSYPYASIITGYFNVESLGSILEKNTGLPPWLWAAIEFRPIAFPHTGIVAIDIHITKYGRELKELQKKLENTPENRDKLEEDIKDTSRILDELEASKKVIRDFIASSSCNNKQNEKNVAIQTEQASEKDDTLTDLTVIDPKVVIAPEIPRLISIEEAARIRRQFIAKGFTVVFTGKQAFTKSISIFELGLRYGHNQVKLDEKIEKEFVHWISILEKEIKVLEEKSDRKSKQSKIHRLERISSLKRESEDLELLVANEDKVFRDELFIEIVRRAKDNGYVILSDDIVALRKYLMKHLFEGRMPENYPDRSIGKTVRILTSDYFQEQNEKPKQDDAPDYLDKVIAIMHDHYMDAKRLTKKQIEAIKEQAGVPNYGMLWEAVELSWLLWYKFYYQEPVSFENRLGAMIRFWNKVQPTYAYSDSSKEQYKQYSTPCPIGAIIAEYTNMFNATRIFEPSAGNGLLVLGADPKKTHVNEIDKNRRASLEAQGFKTITHLNAAQPFPTELAASFDVMVTNPPFATWDADSFDKKRIVDKYFNKYRRLDKNRLRLEHVMSGLALHTLKDSGKAALIIMGHLYFDDRGYIAKARPFFNWLYMHYHVDDVINLNSFKLYNKQGAVAKTMLILIGGRKRNPNNKSIAPIRKEAASLDAIVDTFEELWDRVKSHIKSPLEIVIQKLKIENGYDIL